MKTLGEFLGLYNDKEYFFNLDFTYVEVSFKNKDIAKRLGAGWDSKVKKWFVANESLETFNLIYSGYNNRKELYNKLTTMYNEYDLNYKEGMRKNKELYKNLEFDERMDIFIKSLDMRYEDKFRMIKKEIDFLKIALNI